MTRGFEAATRSTWVAPGSYAFTVDDEWFGLRGPHGGFLSAVLLRAMAAEVADESRFARSLTVHFSAPPQVGPAAIDVRVERRGGRLSTVSARMQQGGGAMCLALAAFSSERPAAIEYLDARPPLPPRLPQGEELEKARRHRGLGRHFDYVRVVGAGTRGGGHEARTGGWLRLRAAVPEGSGPVPVDAGILATFADAWMPAIFTRDTDPLIAPTVDLTVHFRVPTPVAGVDTSDWVYGEFWSKRAEGGFWEEDGELWSADGRLLAQSRQLALAIPYSPA